MRSPLKLDSHSYYSAGGIVGFVPRLYAIRAGDEFGASSLD